MWKIKKVSRRYLLSDAYFVRVRLGRLIQRLRGRRYPSGQIPRIFAILRGCPRHLIADFKHEPLRPGLHRSQRTVVRKLFPVAVPFGPSQNSYDNDAATRLPRLMYRVIQV